MCSSVSASCAAPNNWKHKGNVVRRRRFAEHLAGLGVEGGIQRQGAVTKVYFRSVVSYLRDCDLLIMVDIGIEYCSYR